MAIGHATYAVACSQRQSWRRAPRMNLRRSIPVTMITTKRSDATVPRPMKKVSRLAMNGTKPSAIPARCASTSSMMWLASAEIPTRDVVRCMTWAKIRPSGDMTIRSLASSPAATAALSATSAKTPE